MREQVLTKPVVVPNAMNLDKGKKLSRPRNQNNVQLSSADMSAMATQNKISREYSNVQKEDTLREIEKEINTLVQNENQQINKEKVESKLGETDAEVTVKRGRGRPRKNVAVQEVEETTKKKRGRPKKKIEDTQIEIDEHENTLETTQQDDDVLIPGFDNNDDTGSNNLSTQNNVQDNDIEIPGFDEEPQDIQMPGFADEADDDFEELNMPRFEEAQEQNNNIPKYEQPIERTYNTSSYSSTVQPIQQGTVQTIDISSLLVPGKKVACFVGTSKNGTSFIVNHVAEILSNAGISTAILDTTRNRNAYYIYTKNEEDLRNTATNCLQNLIDGVAKGIQVNKNLAVYTSLPDDNDHIQRSGEILQTLIKNYTVVLIDCDFQTPLSYFAYTQEIYLIQSFDVLTIQPLTAFLRELKARNILDENKLRVVLNKVEKLKGISDKVIIGGMSSYNDPSMSYMVDLFDKGLIKYISIPFDEQVYVKYLEGLINCELTLKGYPKNFVQILNELGNMVYPIIAGKTSGKTSYRPPSVSNNNGGFSPSINSTLEQMRKY